MADKKISALTASTTPLAGTEVLPIVQSSATVKVSVANLTEGRSVGAAKVNVNTSTEFGLLNVSSTGANDSLATLGDFTTPGNSVGIYGRVNGSGVFSIKTAGVAIRLSSDSGLANPVDILDGNVKVVSGKGIDFSATPGTGTSELLADYEEGTWTPVLTCVTPGDLAVTYSAQVGTYTKIGNRCTLNLSITTSAFSYLTASGTVQITGIPFTSNTTTANYNLGALAFGGLTKAGYTQIQSYVLPNVSYVSFASSGSGVSAAQAAIADFPTGGTVLLRGTITYQT